MTYYYTVTARWAASTSSESAYKKETLLRESLVFITGQLRRGRLLNGVTGQQMPRR